MTLDRRLRVVLRSGATTPQDVSVSLALPKGLTAEAATPRVTLQPFGTASVEFRVRGGNLTVTDGPYAEAKEVIGGWAIVNFDSEEEARAEGQAMADLHLKHWPGWEGAVEIRRIAEPDAAPTGS